MMRDFFVVMTVLFALVFRGYGMDVWESEYQLYYAQERIEVYAGLGAYEDGEILYDPSAALRLDVLGEEVDVYHWDYRRLGEVDWRVAGEFGRNYFRIPADFGGADFTPGRYEFRVRLGNRERVVKVTFQELDGLEVSSGEQAFLDSMNSPARVRCLFAPEAPGVQASKEIMYRFSEPAFVRNADEGAFQEMGEWKGEEEIQVRWDTPGRKRIVAEWNGVSKEAFVNVLQPFMTRGRFALLVNANDSDGDGVRDLDQEEMAGDVSDEDLLRLGFPFRNADDFNEVVDPANEARMREVLAVLKERQMWVRITVSPGLRVFSSRNKGANNRVIYHDGAAGIFYEVNHEGRGYMEHEFGKYSVDDSLRFLKDLYLEGYRGSGEEAEDWVEIRWMNQSRNPLWVEKIPVDVLHLRMNYAPSLAEIDPANPVLTGEERLNWIWNPALVPMEGWGGMPVPERGQRCAMLKVEAVGRNILPGMEHRMVRWRIVEQEGENAGDAWFMVDGLNSGKIAHGLEVKVCGAREGSIIIEAGLADAPAPYLRYHAMVAPVVRVPYCFQFFFPKDTKEPNERYYPQVLQFMNNIPAFVRGANVFLRQAGVEMTPITSTQELEMEGEHPVQAVIRWLRLDTVYTVRSEFPQEDPRRLLFDYNFPNMGECVDIHGTDPQDQRRIAVNLPVKNFKSLGGFDAFHVTRMFYETPLGGRLKIAFPPVPLLNFNNNVGILSHYNVPGWVRESFPPATIKYARLPGVCHFNVVKQDKGTSIFLDFNPNDRIDRSARMFAKPANGYAGPDMQRSIPLRGEDGSLRYSLNGRAPTIAYQDPCRSIGVSMVYGKLLEKMQQPHGVSEMGNLLAHHLMAGLNVSYRGTYSCRGITPFDDVRTNRWLPVVDPGPEIVSNLMDPNENLTKTDIDLMQVEIARKSALILNPVQP